MVLRRILIGGMAALLAVLVTFNPPAAKAGNPLNTSFIIADHVYPLEHPAVAYSSLHEEHLVVWCASNAGGSIIFGRKVPKNGPMGAVFPISGTDPSQKHCYPDVAYNIQDDIYLIVWEFNSYSGGSYDNVQGRLLYADGSLSGDLFFDTGGALRNRTNPRVDYGYTYNRNLVVWEGMTSGGVSSDIEGQVVNSNGAKINSNFIIAQGTLKLSHDQPDLAYNISRNEYLVVWRCYDTNDPNDLNYDVYGQRVTDVPGSKGNRLSIGRFSPPESAPSVAALPSPAPQSGIYLVAWQLQYAPGDNDIYGLLVEGDGTIGAAVELTGTDSNLDETNPVVAADQARRRFVGLWASNYGPSEIFHFIGLRGRDITSDGLSGAIHRIDGLYSDQAAAAPGAGGDFLVVYNDAVLGEGNMDIYGRRWGNRIYIPLTRK
jgi:hypothetical protein